MKNQKRRIFAFICIMTMIVALCYTPTTFAATTKSFKTSGKTIVPIVKKGKEISKNTNAALKEAARLGKKGKIYTVKLPKGTYYISESLKIWSNTTLDATGCTIKTKKTGFNMVATGSSEDNRKATGYKRYTNISIKGGTWVNNKKNKSSSIRLCRGSNITLKNIDMSHGSEKHMVEMAAVDGVKIINCKFHDSDIKDSKEKCEAVQLDICANETAYSSIIYDGSPCKNIRDIRNPPLKTGSGIRCRNRYPASCIPLRRIPDLCSSYNKAESGEVRKEDLPCSSIRILHFLQCGCSSA